MQWKCWEKQIQGCASVWGEMAYVFPIAKLLTQAFLLYRWEKSAFPLTVRPDVNLLSFDRYSSHVRIWNSVHILLLDSFNWIDHSGLSFVNQQETRVRLNPRKNSNGSDYINADFVKVKIIQFVVTTCICTSNIFIAKRQWFHRRRLCQAKAV